MSDSNQRGDSPSTFLHEAADSGPQHSRHTRAAESDESPQSGASAYKFSASIGAIFLALGGAGGVGMIALVVAYPWIRHSPSAIVLLSVLVAMVIVGVYGLFASPASWKVPSLRPKWIWYYRVGAFVCAAAVVVPMIFLWRSATDRTLYVNSIQEFYAKGVQLSKTINDNMTDAQIDQTWVDVADWDQRTDSWIKTNMGFAAQARYKDNSDWKSVPFVLTGIHRPGEQERVNKMVNHIGYTLANLQTLMSSSQFDPTRQ